MAYAILLLMVIALIGLGYLLMRFLMNRALRQVISTFKKKEALSPENAKTGDELGLKSTSETRLIDGIFKPRDYKPYVFDSLLQAEIIRMTGDGKFYLSEDTLLSSNLAGYA